MTPTHSPLRPRIDRAPHAARHGGPPVALLPIAALLLGLGHGAAIAQAGAAPDAGPSGPATVAQAPAPQVPQAPQPQAGG